MKGKDRDPAAAARISCLALLLMLSLGYTASVSSAFAKALPRLDGEGSDLRITVRIQDYAQVPQGTLRGAKREAAAILQQAGIETVWLECLVAAPQFQPNPECAQPFKANDLLLRILSRPMAERAPTTDATFGFALQSTDNRPAFAASVFYHHVKELAEKLQFSKAGILGYVMAHEIGHLLLRTITHSPVGIMRAELTREDLLRPLAFTPAEVELIRADVLSRLRGQANAKTAETAQGK